MLAEVAVALGSEFAEIAVALGPELAGRCLLAFASLIFFSLELGHKLNSI